MHVATADLRTSSRLLTIVDPDELRYLIDAGADISVLPLSAEDRQNASVGILQAANGSSIHTFGERSVQVVFGLAKAFTWTVTIAEVSPIIGADFLRYFGLLVYVERKRLMNISHRSGLVQTFGCI